MNSKSKNWLNKSKCLCLLISLVFLTNGISQNLVPNPGFEIFTACPTESFQYIKLALPWYDAGSGSLYKNSCSGALHMKAKQGNAYASIIAYGENDAGSMNLRQYIEVGLLDSLKKGKCYYVEFFINYINQPYYGSMACNNIGAHFSDDTIHAPLNLYYGAVELSPDIITPGNPLLSDSLNWVKISGIYTAKGGEKYLIIGNLLSDDSTKVSGTMHKHLGIAEYNVDNVLVNELTYDSALFKDTSVQIGDSVFIGSTLSGITCTWYQDGKVISTEPGLFVSPTVTTTYTVTQNIPCVGIFNDTLKVLVYQSLQIKVSSAQTSCNGLCDGKAWITASGGIPPYNYLWDNGQKKDSLSTLCQGTYYVTVSDKIGNTIGAKVLIESPFSISTSISVTPSSGHNGTVKVSANGGTPSYTYSWSNGEQTADLNGLTPGKYYVTVYDINNCFKIDSAKVDFVTGVEWMEDLNSIKVYPNPVANGMLNIEAAVNIVNVQIYNIIGERIFDEEARNIDVSNLMKGIYFIKIKTREIDLIKKIVVE